MHKMHANLKGTIIVVLLIVIIINAVFTPTNDIKNIPTGLYGHPSISFQPSDMIHTSIDQIASGDDRIYILFDDHAGIVQAYDSSGHYLYTCSFFCHLNGAFRLAAAGDFLYVQDDQSNLYIFRDDKFDKFIKRQDGEDLRKSIDFESQSTDYEVRWGSVWNVAGEEDICIIQRPAIAAFYQYDIGSAIFCAVIISFGIWRYCRKKRGNS